MSWLLLSKVVRAKVKKKRKEIMLTRVEMILPFLKTATKQLRFKMSQKQLRTLIVEEWQEIKYQIWEDLQSKQLLAVIIVSNQCWLMLKFKQMENRWSRYKRWKFKQTPSLWFQLKFRLRINSMSLQQPRLKNFWLTMRACKPKEFRPCLKRFKRFS